MPRPRDEIMRDLNAIMAELNYAMGNDTGPAGVMAVNRESPDASPKLEQALEATRHRDTSLDTTAGPKTHNEIRAQARAYKPADYPKDSAPVHYDEPGVRRSQRYDEPGIPEKKERLKDYTPADDPNWDSSWALGSGDRGE